MKERVTFAPGMEADLAVPRCSLKYENCQKYATTGYNVHGCAFHYACDSCSDIIMKTLLESFHKFEDMVCTKCNRKLEMPGYVQVTPLRKVS